MGKRNLKPILPITPKKYKFESNNCMDNSFSDVNFRLPKELVNGTVVIDLSKKKWRIGKPAGKGSFGEIYLASDNIDVPVSDDAEYVIKIEPHSSGPLFAEINCLVRLGRIHGDTRPPPGIPIYSASGSHFFNDRKYRFMIIPRYRRDLFTIMKSGKIHLKTILVLAIQILEILEYVHSKGFTHSDIKAQNLMIGVDKESYQNNESFTNNNANIESFNSSKCNSEQLNRIYLRTCNPYRKCRNSDIDKSNESLNCSIDVATTRKSYLRPKELKDRRPSYNALLHNLRPVEMVDYYESSDIENMCDDIPVVHYKTNDKSLENENERVFLIDFGLASKFQFSNGAHKPFYVDERRAHDGTLEYSSRDAHFGAHSRRSDLECLGYNLLDWITGDLPWKDEVILLQPELVHRIKECFMKNVTDMMSNCYSKFPKFMATYLEYVGGLEYNEDPDYEHCKNIFKTEFFNLGYIESDMALNFNESSLFTSKEKCIVKKPSVSKLIQQNVHLRINCTFNENMLNRMSPKNLRSKHSTHSFSPKKLRSKSRSLTKTFCWNEILSNEAEHLLQEKLDHCINDDSGDSNSSNLVNGDFVIKFEGNPTYAINMLTKRLKQKDSFKLKGDERTKLTDAEIDNDGTTYAMKLVIENINKRENKENLNRSKKGNPDAVSKTKLAGRIIKKSKFKIKKHLFQNPEQLKSIVNVVTPSKITKRTKKKPTVVNCIEEKSPIRKRTRSRSMSNARSIKSVKSKVQSKQSPTKSYGKRLRKQKIK